MILLLLGEGDHFLNL